MLLKPGVSISDLKPPIRKKLDAIDRIFVKHTNFPFGMIINSTNGDVHGMGSLHYAHLAIDLNDYGISSTMRELILIDLRAIMPRTHYDILFHNGHFHIEYDPK